MMMAWAAHLIVSKARARTQTTQGRLVALRAPDGLGAASAGCESDHAADDLVHRLCSADVSEVFAPPRVGKEAMKFGLEVGDAMDLTTGWHVTKEEDRGKPERYVDDKKPLVLIGCPPCVAFSQLQSLIPDSERKASQLAEGINYVEFMARLYKKHVDRGRIILHENLGHAKSGALPCIKKLMRNIGGICCPGGPVYVRPEDVGPEQAPAHAGEEAYALHD